MRKHTAWKAMTAILLVAVMALGLAACDSNTPASNPTPNQNDNTPSDTQTPVSANVPDPDPVNTSPINIVWYPNESSNTHTEVRAEVARLIEQATGRKAENKTTTDYTIAIQSIASGQADIAMAMGAVGYIEAKNQNPQVDVLFVNSDKNWSLDEAKYFASSRLQFLSLLTNRTSTCGFWFFASM